MEPTNEERASWAQRAIDAFEVATNMEGEPLETVVGDLLANLMHLCDAEDLDFGHLLARARYNHEAEA